MTDLKQFIVPVVLENTDLTKKNGNKKFNTTDLVFLDSNLETISLIDYQKRASPTDYALANGVLQWWGGKTRTGKRSHHYWLRSACAEDTVFIVKPDGNYGSIGVTTIRPGICPTMYLDVQSIVSARERHNNFFRVKPVKDTDGKIIYYTAEFGEYPKTKASESDRIEKAFQRKSSEIMPTGKKYIGPMKGNETYSENIEYEYRGKRYARVKVNTPEDGNCYEDGTKIPMPGPNNYVWIKVEPITWIIRNWNKMPKSINPKGSGEAEYIDVRTEESIIGGIPFYPRKYEDNNYFWQNSTIRGFLNGINVCNIKTNGNTRYTASHGGDFSKYNFLQEAFSTSLEQMLIDNATPQQEVKQFNPYGFVYDNLSNDELLKLYVKSNVAVFLHGPSGVGKTGRVKQLDPKATRITLRPQMNPEEVDGILDRETGKFIPPLWFSQLTEKCKAEPNRKHVLFIDELTNVKPTVQSLIFSIVLDRAGKDGLWPLPDNAVVVAAGNESSNNLAAYPLTNALFRRFSHIYYEVDKENWLDWATGVSKVQKQEHIDNDTEHRAKIHPAIVAYIMSRDKEVLNQDLDEENPHIVTDPRKWEIASNVLYTTKNPNALLPAIGEELTADFVDFVQSINLSVEDVIKGNYVESKFQEMDISRKLSTLVGLCMAEEKDLPKVRRFIAKTMGKEILATYDSLWIRNDTERAEIIAECNLNLMEESYGLEFQNR